MPKRIILELSRRRVFRGAAIYVIVAWLALQLVGLATEPAAPVRRLALFWAVGLFPLVAVFSWVFQVRPGRIDREDHGEAEPPTTGFGRILDVFALCGLGVIIAVELVRRLM